LIGRKLQVVGVGKEASMFSRTTRAPRKRKKDERKIWREKAKYFMEGGPHGSSLINRRRRGKRLGGRKGLWRGRGGDTTVQQGKKEPGSTEYSLLGV